MELKKKKKISKCYFCKDKPCLEKHCGHTEYYMREKHTCEHCEKEFDTLVTREGFIQTYFVEFVCETCFEKLEGVSFKEYDSDRHYRTNED